MIAISPLAVRAGVVSFSSESVLGSRAGTTTAAVPPSPKHPPPRAPPIPLHPRAPLGGLGTPQPLRSQSQEEPTPTAPVGLEEPQQRPSGGWRGNNWEIMGLFKIYIIISCNRSKPRSPPRMLMVAEGEEVPGQAGTSLGTTRLGTTPPGHVSQPKVGDKCLEREHLAESAALPRRERGRMVPGGVHPGPKVGPGLVQLHGQVGPVAISCRGARWGRDRTELCPRRTTGTGGCLPVPGLGGGSSPASHKLLLLPFFFVVLFFF